jgi:hypothetical protein
MTRQAEILLRPAEQERLGGTMSIMTFQAIAPEAGKRVNLLTVRFCMAIKTEFRKAVGQLKSLCPPSRVLDSCRLVAVITGFGNRSMDHRKSGQVAVTIRTGIFHAKIPMIFPLAHTRKEDQNPYRHQKEIEHLDYHD